MNDISGIGQIDVATRNAEIYRKHKEGYIQSQLAKEYSLSPEWIRRICEDEERKHSPRPGQGVPDEGLSVHDFCNLCTEDSSPVVLYDLEAEKVVFVGSMHDAMKSEYRFARVESFDFDDSGITLNIG